MLQDSNAFALAVPAGSIGSLSAFKRPRSLASLLAIAAMATLSGCMVGPDYQRPTVAVPARFKEAAPGWQSAQPNDAAARGPWWQVFDDAELDRLENKVALSNQTVAAYAAAYAQAQALVSEARASYFPTLGLSVGQTRSKSSSAGFGSGNGNLAGGGISTQYATDLDASWAPDLWGKVRRQVAGEKASAQSAAATLANAQLSAQGTLAQDYFQLRALDAAQQELDAIAASDQKTLALTVNQYKQGVATRSDVLTAQSAWQQAQAAAVDNGIARAQYEHAIAVLVGEPASTFSIAVAPFNATPPTIPAQLPSTLLERRPDVAAAERTAAAANEQIGIAIAAFYPTLTLSASGGFESSAFSNWLTAPARVWSLGPQLAATVFDGGLREAEVKAARASYDQDVANYRAVVLSAFQNVEDNLTSLRVLKQEVALDQAAAESGDQALAIALNQYKAGTGTYLSVMAAQVTADTAHKQWIAARGNQMIAAVGLIEALGGGWQAGDPADERQTSQTDAVGTTK